MNKTRIAAIVVVLVLVAAGGILGLRSWVGIEAGEDLADGSSDSSPSASPSDDESGDPDPDSSATEDPEDADPTPSPSETPDAEDESDRERQDDTGSRGDGGPALASPSGIAADIEARLDRSGPKTSVSCPQAVSSAVGTSFSCSVAYARNPQQAVADAQVNIVGSGLRYVWRSVPR